MWKLYQCCESGRLQANKVLRGIFRIQERDLHLKLHWCVLNLRFHTLYSVYFEIQEHIYWVDIVISGYQDLWINCQFQFVVLPLYPSISSIFLPLYCTPTVPPFALRSHCHSIFSLFFYCNSWLHTSEKYGYSFITIPLSYQGDRNMAVLSVKWANWQSLDWLIKLLLLWTYTRFTVFVTGLEEMKLLIGHRGPRELYTAFWGLLGSHGPASLHLPLSKYLSRVMSFESFSLWHNRHSLS